jgi:purine-binding chemotaxis protein CheW
MSEQVGNQESKSRFLCFILGKEKFAMPLLQVKEVIANTETTNIPQAAPHFRGIMNLRGQVISIIDLRVKLKVGKPESTPETTIVILDVNGMSLGVVVDSVSSVTTFDSSNISEPPVHDSSAKTDYIFGVARHEKDLTLLIDLKKVLNTDDLKTMKSQTSKVA